jgi:hypothetical protein
MRHRRSSRHPVARHGTVLCSPLTRGYVTILTLRGDETRDSCVTNAVTKSRFSGVFVTSLRLRSKGSRLLTRPIETSTAATYCALAVDSASRAPR